MARITVEDCLAIEPNRFALVILASMRGKQLLGGATPLCDSEGNKPLVVGLREIAAGKVRWMTAEESEREAELERQRAVEAELAATPAISPTNGSSAPMAIPNGMPRFERDGGSDSGEV